MLKSYFESYFGINDFQGDYQTAYSKLVDSLYALFVRKGFQKTELGRIWDTFDNRQNFGILSLLMEKAGIFDNIDTQLAMNKLNSYLSDPFHKEELRTIFKSDEGKQRILESFLTSFVTSNTITDKIVIPRMGWQAPLMEVRYNLYALSYRTNAFFKNLIQKVETEPKYSIADLFNQKVYGSTIYDPKNPAYSNKLQLEGLNDVDFYSSSTTPAGRIYDALAIVEIMDTSFASEIKSTILENIFEVSQFNLPNMLGNDALSSLINAFDRSRDSSLIPSLTTQIITLAAPLVSQLNFPSEAFSDVRTLLKNLLSKGMSDLGHKLEDHELFLVELVKLINSEIIIRAKSHVIITELTLKKFIKDLFADKDFKAKVLGTALVEFKSTHFPTILSDGNGYQQLLTLLKRNLDQIAVSLPSTISGRKPRVLLSLSYDFDPHFRSDNKLSIQNDFINGWAFVYDPASSEGVRCITSDLELAEYRVKYEGALKVFHIKNNFAPYANLILVPTSLIETNNLKKVPTTLNPIGGGSTLFLEEGWQDWNTDIVYHNIYAADGQDYKLNSKLIFTKDEVRIHKNFYWAEEFFDFDYDYDLLLDKNIISFQSKFMAAYTFTRGYIIITGLTDVILNLQNTESSPDPFPNLRIPFTNYKGKDVNIIPFNTILPEWSQRIESYSRVLTQLAGEGMFSGNFKGTQPLAVDNYFLNLLESEIIYTVEGFKKILSKLGLTNADFAKITRGTIQADGTFAPSVVTRQQFYEEWFNIIQKDVKPPSPPNLVFKGHDSLGVGLYTGSDNQIAMINAALQDALGYPAFICLLAGIMTFAQDSDDSQEYRIDFSIHRSELQAKLLNDFVGRSHYDTTKGDIGPQYLSFKPRKQIYFTGIFMFGTKLGIMPLKNDFVANYYQLFNPKNPGDYLFAINQIINKHFSQFLGSPKEVKKLNTMLLDGVTEIYDFYENMLFDNNFVYSSTILKTVDRVQLMRRIQNPGSRDVDYSLFLRLLGFTKQSFEIKTWSGIPIAPNSNDLRSAIDSSLITSNAMYRWSFGVNQISEGVSQFYNDFDIVWSSGFSEKFMTAYDKLKEIFTKAPVGDTLKIDFLGRTTNGIDKNYKISTEQKDFPAGDYLYIKTLFDTEFSGHEIIFKPSDSRQLTEAVVSMLLLMTMEPNVFVNVKVESSNTLNVGDNFLNLDIFDLYDNDILHDGTVFSSRRIEGSFVWTQTGAGAVLTQEAFEAFENDFKKIFQYRDIMNFNGFNNHEQDSNANTMFDYVKDKIFGHFISLGIFIVGRSKLTDLR